MTGFDSTWYHGPFAAGFHQSGNTWDLHFIAPQFLAWFYPANAEIFHAVGMLAFDRDLLSPLLNLGWFIGCLFALWCIGRPLRVGAYSVLLGALILIAPLLSDQAGEARNDIVAIFFLLAAVAVALNAAPPAPGDARRLSRGALLVAGLAAGLAAGTKLNYLLPSAALLIGIAVAAPAGGALADARRRDARGSRRRRLLVPAEPRPHRQPAAVVHRPRPALAARPRPDARRPRRPQRPRLPDRRLGLVGMVPARPPPRPDDLLAPARRPRPRRPPPGPRSRAQPIRPRRRRRRPGGRTRLDRRPNLRLRPGRHPPRLRIRPPLPGPGTGHRHGPAARSSCSERLRREGHGASPERADTQSADLIRSALVGAGDAPWPSADAVVYWRS